MRTIKLIIEEKTSHSLLKSSNILTDVKIVLVSTEGVGVRMRWLGRLGSVLKVSLHGIRLAIGEWDDIRVIRVHSGQRWSAKMRTRGACCDLRGRRGGGMFDGGTNAVSLMGSARVMSSGPVTLK